MICIRCGESNWIYRNNKLFRDDRSRANIKRLRGEILCNYIAQAWIES